MYNDLVTEIGNKTALLETAIRELGKRGMAYAEAEKEYRIALAKKELQEREKGTPVTIISDICRGSDSIATMRFKRDCALVVYKNAQEAVNAYKLEIKILDNQLSREWNNA